MRTIVVGALWAIAMVANANAAIKEEPVTYKDGETTLKGFVVYDDAITAKQPGIVMVHEWWGITNHIHNEARKFAQQGYTAFIADMYGDAKTADNPKDAGALSSSVMKNPTVMESRFNAAREQLAKQASVDPQRIGAVGYCFGGAVVLNMARAGADLAAVAAFHASLGLNTPAPSPGTVKADSLILKRRGRSLRRNASNTMRSRRISTQLRPIIGSSSIPARCTRSRIPRLPSSARNLTCRSDMTARWIKKRRPRRTSSLPLAFRNR